MSYGSRKRSYDQEGCVRGVDLRLRRITSSPSQTLPRRLVRTTAAAVSARLDARCRSSRLYFSYFVTRTVDNSVDLYAAKPDIRPESRFLPTPPAFDGFPSEYRHPVWHGNTRMAWLPERDRHTDRRTHRRTPHDDIGRAYASHRAAKTGLLT